MTKEEAWKRYQAERTTENRNAVAECYLPLVQAVARTVRQKEGADLTLEDLVSMGVVGLLQAIERYEPEKGGRFMTFAWKRVYGEMADHLSVI